MPETLTVTPATEPSTTVSASCSWACMSWDCMASACSRRAFMSKPPAPPNGLSVMGWAFRSAWSLVRDLLDHPGRRARAPAGRRCRALGVGVEVVGPGVGVGLRQRGPDGLDGASPAGRVCRMASRAAACPAGAERGSASGSSVAHGGGSSGGGAPRGRTGRSGWPGGPPAGRRGRGGGRLGLTVAERGGRGRRAGAAPASAPGSTMVSIL